MMLFFAVKVLEIINNNDKKLSDLVDEIQEYLTPRKLELTVMIIKSDIKKITERQK